MKKMIAILLSFVLMFFVLNAVLPGDVGTAIGLSVSVILNFLGGESAYVSALKTFLILENQQHILNLKHIVSIVVICMVIQCMITK